MAEGVGGVELKLVSDWKKAYKWFSVQANLIALALPAAWTALPDDFQNAIPGGVVTAMSAAALIALVGRIVDQGGGAAGRT